ncbi:MAG: heavy metal-associated domain-containing protein, partial [Chloroflexi bacterium]|nr:heavy metal-associated domain-containing protein [Chloroflexota bacterium]
MFTLARTSPLRGLAHLLRLHPRRLALAPTIAAYESAGPDRARVRVDGMVCAACAARTSVALGRVDGVRDVTVDLEAGSAMFRYEAGHPPAVAELQRALDTVVVAAPARRVLARWADR